MDHQKPMCHVGHAMLAAVALIVVVLALRPIRARHAAIGSLMDMQAHVGRAPHAFVGGKIVEMELASFQAVSNCRMR